MSLIEIDNVSKVFKKGKLEVKPLQSVSMIVEAGEFVALMGPSGSGKTTLLNLIAGLDKPTEGRIVIAGQEIGAMGEYKLARWRTRTIGYIFQLYNLIPVLTAYENVELPLTLLRLSGAERRARTMVALEAVGLSDRLDHYPRQLSGGQEQRVAIARAIVTDPKILVADEPTGDLDRDSAEEILDLMHQLHEEFKKTFIMVTHDHKAAEQAERLVHLEKGFLDEVRNSVPGIKE